MSEWISVEDRLPDENGLFLTCTHVGAILIQAYDVEKGWTNIAGKDPIYWNMVICDWMPLPEPPKDLTES